MSQGADRRLRSVSPEDVGRALHVHKPGQHSQDEMAARLLEHKLVWRDELDDFSADEIEWATYSSVSHASGATTAPPRLRDKAHLAGPISLWALLPQSTGPSTAGQRQ